MRLRYWFVVVIFFVGLALFLLGLYLIYRGGEPQLGFDLSVIGAVLMAVLIMVGMLYVARVKIKILRDAAIFRRRAFSATLETLPPSLYRLKLRLFLCFVERWKCVQLILR